MIAFETGARVGRRAFSEGFAGDVAKRLAYVLHRLISADPVTFVAGAYCRTRAGAVHARFLTDRLADVARVTQETVALVAKAGLRHDALAHHAWFAANRVTDRVPFQSVACIAGADVGRRAFAGQTTSITLWITKVIDVPVTLVTFVANANARRRALAVYAAGIADRQAFLWTIENCDSSLAMKSFRVIALSSLLIFHTGALVVQGVSKRRILFFLWNT